MPALTPVTTPLPEMVATDGVLLLHVPPDTLFESVVVEPIPTLVAPVIEPGVRPLVTIMFLTEYVGQVPDNQYVIHAVPADTPVTTPEELTVAVAEELLLHVPPDIVVVIAAVPPIHTLDGPVMESAGVPTTVTTLVTEHEPML